MKPLIIFILAALSCLTASAQSPLPLDSVQISFPVKVADAQLAWKLVQDDNVRTAIATAVDTTTDTAATVSVVLTGMQIVTVHSTITKQSVGVVRPLSAVLEATLLPFLMLPENAALAAAFSLTEGSNISLREATRRAGERGCREQSATIRRNR